MQPPASPPINEDEQKRRRARFLASAYSLAWGFPASIGVGIGLGWWLDKHFRTSPWLIIVFGALGAIGGFVQLFRLVKGDGSGE
jgi:F0F1-type ATP synthase assembly protein I